MHRLQVAVHPGEAWGQGWAGGGRTRVSAPGPSAVLGSGQIQDQSDCSPGAGAWLCGLLKTLK